MNEDDSYSKKKKLNIDSLNEVIENLKNEGDTEKIGAYGNVLVKRMMDYAKDDPENAMEYLKGAINTYGILGAYDKIKEVIQLAGKLGVPRPELIMSDPATEEEMKVMKMFNEAYGPYIVQKVELKKKKIRTIKA